MIDPPDEANYPTLEGLVETLGEDQVDAVFDELRSRLASLKGARQTQAKRVEKALAHCRDLIAHLLEVRRKLERDREENP